MRTKTCRCLLVIGGVFPSPGRDSTFAPRQPWHKPPALFSSSMATQQTTASPAVTARCDYWNLINGTGTSGSGLGHSALNVFIAGATNSTSFSTGSKDIAPISQWSYGGLSCPPKDCLNAGYAAAYDITDFDVIFGADRAVPNGDANIGIWFFQQNVTLNGTGKFIGSHVNAATCL